MHYRVLRNYHLGDRWARLNYALRLLEQGEEFGLWLSDRNAEEIIAALDVGTLKPNILVRRPNSDPLSRKLIHHIDSGTTAYSCRYFSTFARHSSSGLTIGYTFSANWRVDQKVPPGLDNTLATLKSELSQYTFVPLGLPHQNSVTELIATLAGVSCIVSVDNGVAHVARSVGVPIFLVEYEHPLSRGFPVTACSYTRVTKESLVKDVAAALSGQRIPGETAGLGRD